MFLVFFVLPYDCVSFRHQPKLKLINLGCVSKGCRDLFLNNHLLPEDFTDGLLSNLLHALSQVPIF